MNSYRTMVNCIQESVFLPKIQTIKSVEDGFSQIQSHILVSKNQVLKMLTQVVIK